MPGATGPLEGEPVPGRRRTGRVYWPAHAARRARPPRASVGCASWR